MISGSAAMRFLMDDVREFHEKMCGSADPRELQTKPLTTQVRLRAKLIVEEGMETLWGMFYGNRDQGELKQHLRKYYEEINTTEIDFNIEAVADGLADLIYVCVGAALAFGIPLERVWAEVQRANMAKDGGGRSEAGKILKPDGWQPPNIREAIFGEAT